MPTNAPTLHAHSLTASNDVPLDDDMEAVTHAFRKGLVVHCYQFLGSFPDAEEATQETLVRAWRSRDGFRGDSTTKTWLYSIATRVCLDLLRVRKRRVVPSSLSTASDPNRPLRDPAPEVAWLGPLPTEYLTDGSHDPAAAYSASESVRLAFVAALQTLPARQRAVLILRDVLTWSAAEVAVTLECSVASVNSLLHRARRQMRDTHHGAGADAFPDVAIDDAIVAATLERFVQAWQANDIDELVDTLSADVRLAMPPVPSWYSGRDDVVAFLQRFVAPLGPCRLTPAHFNAQPGFTFSFARIDAPIRRPGAMVLTIGAAGISAIDVFPADDVAA